MRHNNLQTIGPHGHEAPSAGQQKSPLDAIFQLNNNKGKMLVVGEVHDTSITKKYTVYTFLYISLAL